METSDAFGTSLEAGFVKKPRLSYAVEQPILEGLGTSAESGVHTITGESQKTLLYDCTIQHNGIANISSSSQQDLLNVAEISA